MSQKQLSDKKPCLSVIVPTYRPRDYVKLCVKSIAEQVFRDPNFQYELILVLNGERDPYESYLTEILSSYPALNAELVYSEQKGVSQARNLGMSLARGEYLTFVDDDDFISPSYLYALYAYSRKGYSPVAERIDFADGAGEEENLRLSAPEFAGLPPELFTESLFALRAAFSSACFKLYPRKPLHAHRFDTQMTNNEDSLFAFETSYLFARVLRVPRACYYRRVRAASLSDPVRRTPGKQFSDALSFARKVVVIYIGSPRRYSFPFFCSRLLAPFKGLWVRCIKGRSRSC